MNAIAIIPARGGSRRIPHKNIKHFHGKPIIAYSIEKAIQSELFDRVIVSTEDPNIAKIASIFGAETHERGVHHAQDDVGTQEVMAHVLTDLGWQGEFACCIYATAPLMSVGDLKRGYMNGELSTYSFSVGYPPLRDAGQFYWGRTRCFLERLPLINVGTSMIHVNNNRVCDINTMDDWERAEQMYSDLGVRLGGSMG